MCYGKRTFLRRFIAMGINQPESEPAAPSPPTVTPPAPCRQRRVDGHP